MCLIYPEYKIEDPNKNNEVKLPGAMTKGNMEITPKILLIDIKLERKVYHENWKAFLGNGQRKSLEANGTQFKC